MDDIDGIVQEIVERAAASNHGAAVSKTLAAFVAKTVILGDPAGFQLDKGMAMDDLDRLVARSVRLLCEDSARMQTMRMQCGFDECFVQVEKATEEEHKARSARSGALVTDIVAARGGSDYDAIKALYRQIFNFLVKDAEAYTDGKKQDGAKREIAAAQESIFPQAGLPAFIDMPAEEKRTHLDELSHIVVGIRLFNAHIGKGGAGLVDVRGLAMRRVQELIRVLQEEQRAAQELCRAYGPALVQGELLLRNGDVSVAGAPSAAELRRWQDESNNRRQLLAYVTCLVDDAKHSLHIIEKTHAEMEATFDRLEDLVGAKASLPKATVYPLFDALGREHWARVVLELAVVQSREEVWKCLSGFKDDFHSTLDLSWMGTGEAALASGRAALDAEEKERNAEEKAPESHGAGSDDIFSPVLKEHVSVAERKKQERAAATATATATATAPEQKATARAKTSARQGESKEAGEAKCADEGVNEDVELLAPNAPGFKRLAVSLQGFCPWTLAERGGLALLGDARLGLVRFRGRHTFAFQTADALHAFMAEPARIFEAVLARARAAPELILLLELEENFPELALGAGMLRGGRAKRDGDGGVQRVDASTGTPTHFVERHVDPSYEWNEWTLRKKALRLVNLRNAKTTSAQTAGSHFRRSAETQVYLPRSSGTQTGVQRGTNPPRQVQYIAGLRGLTKTRFAKSDSDACEAKRAEPEPGASVINMTFEL